MYMPALQEFPFSVYKTIDYFHLMLKSCIFLGIRGGKPYECCYEFHLFKKSGYLPYQKGLQHVDRWEQQMKQLADTDPDRRNSELDSLYPCNHLLNKYT